VHVQQRNVVAGLVAKSQYPEGPATVHLGTGFLRFPVSKRECWDGSQHSKLLLHASSCSLTDLNFLEPYFIFMYMHNNHCHRATAHLQWNFIIIIIIIINWQPNCSLLLLLLLYTPRAKFDTGSEAARGSKVSFKKFQCTGCSIYRVPRHNTCQATSRQTHAVYALKLHSAVTFTWNSLYSNC
jgi:hypothetical protein